MKTSKRPLRLGLLLLALQVATTSTVNAQTTTFTYQGKLADAALPANGSYDFDFKLFDALTGGSGIGSASVTGVMVTNGIFTVNLDFGVCAACFNGANRFLEISVKPTSDSTYTLLSPRQQVTSAPYAIKSQNAATADGLSVACVNCVTSSQIASVSGSAVTGTIPVSSVPAGSGSYIHNTFVQQAASNFNISGNGTAAGTISASTVNAATQYNLGGARVLSNPGSFNLFAGVNAGAGNTGTQNSFFGYGAGSGNTSGGSNSFFGMFAGQSNMAGISNSFFGFSAGAHNTANFNSFFGHDAGLANTMGSSNSFFGNGAGGANTMGDINSFFGQNAGADNTMGSSNSFFGENAGAGNMTGGSNSFFGASAGLFATGSFNSFFGAGAGSTGAGGDSNVFLGYQAGLSNTTGKRNVMVGRGADFRSTQASSSGAVAGDENIFLGFLAGGAAARRNAAAIGRNAFVACDDCMVLGTTGVKVGIGLNSPQQNLSVNGGLVIDQADLNDGALPPGTNTGLTFGSGSGEGIVSKRTASGNQFGLDFYTNFLKRMSITNAGNVGIGTDTPFARLWVEGDTRITGRLTVSTLSAATAIHLCTNVIFELSLCSSSIRYKTNVLPLNSGLELISRLRPVTFDWIATRERDLGLIAEEVEKAEPLLVTRNKTGQIEGVKYDQLNVVLINAIKEQQSQIAQQQIRMEAQQIQIDTQLSQIKRQQSQIESLVKVICLDHLGAEICRKP